MGLLDDLDLSAIRDERARRCVVLLLNLVEQLKREDAELPAEVQRLRDEIARLKGEQPGPKIRGNTPKSPPTTPTNYSSEKERRIPKEWTKANMTETIPIDREETVVLDSTTLPEDAELKGHEDVVVQDIVLGTDNVLFHKEKFYSPSQGETYLGKRSRVAGRTSRSRMARYVHRGRAARSGWATAAAGGCLGGARAGHPGVHCRPCGASGGADGARTGAGGAARAELCELVAPAVE